MYRIASCNGVKLCPVDSCDYVAPVFAQRPCSVHNSHKLIKSNEKEPCPVQFAYLYPKDVSDDRRWIFAFVRHQKIPCNSLHSHPIHGSSKICSKVKQMIAEATEINPTLKPSDIVKGKGVLAIPGAIDMASNHIGRIAREVRKSKQQTTAGSNWDVSNFEQAADEVDSKDEELTGDVDDSLQIKRLARPYLVAAGIENGTKFIFCMSPFMCSLLAESEFVEADVTYNKTREYPYLFNMVAFNYVTMDWVVVSRVRMNKQDAAAYGLAYSKTFAKCRSVHNNFEPGKSLAGVVVDWSDAEIKGLGIAVGKELAVTLLKGCKVHWTRSWQRVRDRVVTSEDKVREKRLFSSIASHIPNISAGNNVVAAFEVLCKKKTANNLVGMITGLTKDDAKFIDSSTNWTNATKWVEWWMRPQHLKLLHKDYTEMNASIWECCPSDTNAVERKNLDSKEALPQQLQIAMINLYKYDKAACAKSTAARKGVSVSYCDQSQDARRSEAAKRNMRRYKATSSDLTTQYGPPDRQCHFEKCGKKRKNSISCNSENVKRPKITTVISDDDSDFEEVKHGKFHQLNSNYLGRKLQMRFRIKETGKYEWFNGQILNFDPNTGKYGAFFPSDGQTIYINPSQEGDDIIFYK